MSNDIKMKKQGSHSTTWFSTGDDYDPLLDPNPYPQEKCTTTRKVVCFLLLLVISLTVGLIIGFAMDWGEDQQTQSRGIDYWQNEFVKYPSNDSCRQFTVDLASKPHIASYPQQFETGQYIADLFNAYNYETTQYNFTETVLSHFVSSSLRILNTASAPIWNELDISEEIIDSDPYTDNPLRFHIYNAYAATANVTGNIIYINYGLRSDYEYLVNSNNYTSIASNLSFVGKIGLVRFGGGIGRNIKVKIGQEYGLIALLIFSDPQQYAQDLSAVYPNGPWLPSSGIQRGSVLFAACPGNPSLQRLNDLCGIADMSEAIPSIPVLPISYGTTKILFDSMDDINIDIAPTHWKGGILTEYKINSSHLMLDLRVRNELHFNDTIQNVYAIYHGSQYPAQTVMLGAHRDSWGYGAQDDVSGTATMMEIARIFNILIGAGWRPKRSIVFASWDGEESAVIGSTNFGESLQEKDLEILHGMVSYINLDMTTAGDTFVIDAHPLLKKISVTAMKQIQYNESMTFYDIWDNDFNLVTAGSDYEVFANYLGIVAADIGFKKQAQYASYHSIYDTIHWQDIVDPHWFKAQAIVKYVGVLIMKLLDMHIIPFDLAEFASKLREWFDYNLTNAAFDRFECNPNGLTTTLMQELSNTIDTFIDSAILLNDMILNGTIASHGDNYQDLVEQFNECLIGISRKLRSNNGLPQSKWHKNILWSGAAETPEIEFYPYIWNTLQYNCTQEMLNKSFAVTQDIIHQTKLFMDQYVNTTYYI